MVELNTPEALMPVGTNQGNHLWKVPETRTPPTSLKTLPHVEATELLREPRLRLLSGAHTSALYFRVNKPHLLIIKNLRLQRGYTRLQM